MQISAIRLIDQAQHPEREHPAEDMREIDAERVCAAAVTTVTLPPRSGATPSASSTIAPMAATMNAAVSPRKKFIAPIAAPDLIARHRVLDRDGADRIGGADAERDDAEHDRDRSIGGIAGFQASSASAAIEHARPIIGTRL